MSIFFFRFRSVSTIEAVNIDDEQFVEIVNQYNEWEKKNSEEQQITAAANSGGGAAATTSTPSSSKVNLFFKF